MPELFNNKFNIVNDLGQPDVFRGVMLNNNIYILTNNSIGTLEALLKLAITSYPNTLDKIQKETTGRSRSLISKQKSKLYKNRPDLEINCSKQLPNAWWLGTNYGKMAISRFCCIIEKSINSEYGNQNIKWKI